MKIRKIINNNRISDVYNMEVEDVHCFSATESKIIIHNCVDSLRYGCKYLANKNSLKDTAIRVGI